MIEGRVGAAYSQIELCPGPDEPVPVVDVGLATTWGDQAHAVTLIVAREYGQIPVAVELADAPPPLDPAWDAVVELSMQAGDDPAVTGWGGDGIIPLPEIEGMAVRVRYVVQNGEEAKHRLHTGQEAGVDRCLLQFWPAEPEPPRVVVSTSPWSQYWTFGVAATAAARACAHLPEPAGLLAVIDRALIEHPDVAAAIRAGDGRYRSGVLRYAQELLRLTFRTRAYADVRHDSERLAALIDARARA